MEQSTKYAKLNKIHSELTLVTNHSRRRASCCSYQDPQRNKFLSLNECRLFCARYPASVHNVIVRENSQRRLRRTGVTALRSTKPHLEKTDEEEGNRASFLLCSARHNIQVIGKNRKRYPIYKAHNFRETHGKFYD